MRSPGLALVAIFMAGCTAMPLGNSPGSQEAAANGDADEISNYEEGHAGPAFESVPVGPEDGGDFVLVVSPSDAFSSYETTLSQSRFVSGIVDHLNSFLALDTDVTVYVRECGAVNAFYDPGASAVSLCYELMADIASRFAEFELSDTEYQDAMSGAVKFILLHEVGHALIDAFDAPSTGREEDAADSFAAVLLLAEGYEGAKSVAYAAGFWATRAGSTPAWDEHSLDEVRLYNLLCYLYGSNPSAYSSIVNDGVLPQARAERCPNEYQDVRAAWLEVMRNRLLVDLDDVGDVRGPRVPPFPPAPAIDHAIEHGKGYVVPAGTSARREFSMPKSGGLTFSVARSDSSTMDVGVIRATDWAAYNAGQQVTGWGYQSDVGSAEATVQLAAGSYALVIHCNNSFADCDGNYSLTARY